jgi:hyperosmotically inducible periplasmic protein
MRRLFALLVLLALVGIALYYWKYRPAGESPQQALGSVGDKIRGAKTTAEIKAALELNRNLKPYAIGVDVADDGTVTLKGELPREDFKTEAERVTVAVPGVRSVRNEIVIDPALPPPAEGGRTLGENFDDKALEAKVKLAFSLNKSLDGTDLSVRAYRRDVTVGGVVDTPEQHQLALKVAADTADVVKVSDEIQLRGQPAAAPAAARSPTAAPGDRARSGDRARAVKQALAANPSLAAYDIQVREEGGRLILRGRVKTTAEKDLAGLLARDAAGAQVDNALEVRL